MGFLDWGSAIGTGTNAFMDSYSKMKQLGLQEEAQKRAAEQQAMQMQIEQQRLADMQRAATRQGRLSGLMNEAIYDEEGNLDPKLYLEKFLKDATPQEALSAVGLFQPKTMNEQQLLMKAAGGDAQAIKALQLKNDLQRPPVGYERTADGTLRPIQGGPIDQKKQELIAKKQGVIDTIFSNYDNQEAKIDALLNNKSLGEATGKKGWFMETPVGKAMYAGSNAYNIKTQIDSLKASLGLDTLASLKAGTGAGLGSVTEAEHKLLQGYIASLDASQTEEELRSNLTKIKAFIAQSRLNLQKGLERTTSLGNPSGGTMADRNNNPLNIKIGGATQKWVDAGDAEIGAAGKDGGNFLKFSSPEKGIQAAVDLLQSGVYSNLTVDQAMRKWSNNGYGASKIAPALAGKKMSDLTQEEIKMVIKNMARAEGSTMNFGGNSAPAAYQLKNGMTFRRVG